MGATTKIEWCDHTFNAWRGCARDDAGCINCYAEGQAKRNPALLGVWGADGTRVVASEAMWAQPKKWNDAAAAEGIRRRVFSQSMSDLFEDWDGPMVNHLGGEMFYCTLGCRQWLDGAKPSVQGAVGPFCAHCQKHTMPLSMGAVRRRLFGVTDSTPWLDWLLVTKRPEHIPRLWPRLQRCQNCGSDQIHDRRINDVLDTACRDCGAVGAYDHRTNVWLGTSICDQETADKNVPLLHACRSLTPVLFLSIEPLVGPVDLSELLTDIDWVIVGGESGDRARPCHTRWIHDLVDQCHFAHIPLFIKQLGERVITTTAKEFPEGTKHAVALNAPDPPLELQPLLKDKKGGDPAEWPEDLHIRQFPEVSR